MHTRSASQAGLGQRPLQADAVRHGAFRSGASGRTPRLARPFGAGTALVWTLVFATAAPTVAQNTGSILGRVTEAGSGRPLAGALVEAGDGIARTLSGDEGRFLLVAVPSGRISLRVSLIGFRTETLDTVPVRAGRPTRVDLQLVPEAVPLPGVVATAERVRLVEPEISATHQVVLGTELRTLPVDAVDEAIELTPGVSDGHFRGGRIGQEVYVVDGLEFKNSLEASSQGAPVQLPPTALEEVEVVTGGLGARYGSALSGVVRYVTRRGDPRRWSGTVGARTDQWAPERIFRGFTEVSLAGGGPLRFLGEGATLYADAQLQGMADSDPRARGLTCLREEDVDGGVADAVRSLASDPAVSGLYCPYTDPSFPHQRGEKYLGLIRLDRPLFRGGSLAASVVLNRIQRQLYTPEFKYNPTYQLGQRTSSGLAVVSLNVNRQGIGRGVRFTARGSAFRQDRYLGTLDPWTFDERATVGDFGWSDYRFLGEDFVRSPVQEQLLAGSAVPGYRRPGGSSGSPFGPAAEGIFFTEGTPDIANWSRSEFLGGDVQVEMLTARGHTVGAGVSGKAHRVQAYERVRSHLPGSSPSFARFFPATVSGFAEAALAAADGVTIQVGGRVEAFRAGLTFREDAGDFLAPEVDTEWQVSVMPRMGVSAAVPGTDGRTAVRFNFGQVTQPPDFRFFLDTAIGDSLRTDIRRQGNPGLGFERGTSYELGLSHTVTDGVGTSLTAFRKELTNLVTGSLQFSGYAPGQFTTGDFGTVHGVELSFRARLPGFRLQGGYALQKATGVVSSALESEERPGSEREEAPLAFDRRHSADVAVFLGSAAGDPDTRWGAVAVGSARSGFPLNPGVVEPDSIGDGTEFLPWTIALDLRVSLEIGTVPGCRRCRARVVADGRNVFDRKNVIALRRETGTLAPSLAELDALAAGSLVQPIPRESPRYSALIDFDGDGRITDPEYRRARRAAALDRYDPSLFFDEALQLRLGLEVGF